MSTRRSLVILCALAIAACDDKKESKPSPTATPASSPAKAPSASASASTAPTASTPRDPAPPGPTSVAAKVDGYKGTLTFARVTAGEWFPKLTVSAKEIACDKEPDADVPRIVIPLVPGPGGKFFAGTDYQPSIRVELSAMPEGSDPIDTLVRLEPFELKKGGRVKGTIAFSSKRTRMGKSTESSANGSFDAVVCAEQPVAALDESAADGPVKGEDTGSKFEAKSAVAMLAKDELNGIDYVDRILFFAKADVACDKVEEAKFESFLTVQDIGGLTSKRAAIGKPMSASATLLDMKTSEVRKQSSGAWVKVDAAELKEGGVVKGAIVAARVGKKPEESSKISGHFEAKVCK